MAAGAAAAAAAAAATAAAHLTLSSPLRPAEKNYDETADSDPSQRTWLERALTGSSSSLALAFICNKALFPLRAPITVALTPAVARCAGGRVLRCPYPLSCTD